MSDSPEEFCSSQGEMLDTGVMEALTVLLRHDELTVAPASGAKERFAKAARSKFYRSYAKAKHLTTKQLIGLLAVSRRGLRATRHIRHLRHP